MAKPVSPRGFARARVLAAALTLFAEHGVDGTSLQMIADRLGVSKAAVYYQFQSKDEIAVEVVRPAMEDMARVVRIAEAFPDWNARREVAVSGTIELAVRHRKLSSIFHGDPAVLVLIRDHPEFKPAIDRIYELMIGPENDAPSRIAVSMVLSGIHGSAADPVLADITDTDLHQALLHCAYRILRPDTEDPSRVSRHEHDSVAAE